MSESFAINNSPFNSELRGYSGSSAVQVNFSPKSELENALEELGSAVSERRTRSLKEVKGKEKVERGHIHWIEQIQQYLEKVPDLEKQQKLLSFVSANLGKSVTGEQFIQSLSQFSQEPAAQYLAGKVLIESSEPSNQRCFSEALEAFAAEHQKEILVMLNTSRTYAESLPEKDIGRARDEYRNITICKSCSQLWRQLAQMAREYGSVDSAITLHQQALSADYHSLNPSHDHAILGQVMSNLGQLKQLNTLSLLAESVVRLLKNQFLITVEQTALVERVLTFPENQIVSRSMLTTALKHLGVNSLNARVVITQEFRKMAVALPDSLYPSENHRNRVLSSLQERIDEAVSMEEVQLDDKH